MPCRVRASLRSACGVLLLSTLCFPQTNAGVKDQSSPISVGQDEVRDHIVGDLPLVRMALPEREAAILGMEGIGVRITVDANGTVASANADKSVSADLRSRAEAAAKSTRFRPFERDGYPVAATFEDRIAVLPPELVPKRRIPFPTIPDWDSVRIAQSHRSTV
jgi:hypothetical protein